VERDRAKDGGLLQRVLVMKVAIDLRTVREGMTGVGRYTWRLASSLLEAKSDHEIHAFFAGEGSAHWAAKARELGACVSNFRLSTEAHPVCDLWEQTGLPLWLDWKGFDLFFSGTFLSPWWSRRAKRVFVVHDLIAFLHPETMPVRFAQYSRWQTRWSSKYASGIVCNSWNTLRDLARWVPGAEEKAVVIHAGLWGGRTVEGVREENFSVRASIPPWMERPFFLAVGTDPRKNLLFLAESYLAARTECPSLPKLVIVGGETEESGKIREYAKGRAAEEHILLAGYLPDDLLSLAYAKAETLLFPSLYEGFGYPPLEAMSAGTPVLASDRGSIAEVVGDAGLLMDANDSLAWRDGMVKIWLDRRWREQWTRRGLKRVETFSQERTAALLLEALDRWR